MVKGYHVHHRDDPTDMEIFSIDTMSMPTSAQQGPQTFAFECDDAGAIHEAFCDMCPAHHEPTTTQQASAMLRELTQHERSAKQVAGLSICIWKGALYPLITQV
jgi:hypothetical protein